MIFKRLANVFWAGLITALLLNSCDQTVVYEQNKPLVNESWTYDDLQHFQAEIKDTSARYNIYVNLRHSFHFEWRNLWVKIETVFPDGKKVSKRVNLLLSEANGVWFGKCSSGSCFIQIPIQENAIFPGEGIYKFTIAQDMRVSPLKNIRAVGIRIERNIR